MVADLNFLERWSQKHLRADLPGGQSQAMAIFYAWACYMDDPYVTNTAVLAEGSTWNRATCLSYLKDKSVTPLVSQKLREICDKRSLAVYLTGVPNSLSSGSGLGQLALDITRADVTTQVVVSPHDRNVHHETSLEEGLLEIFSLDGAKIASIY